MPFWPGWGKVGETADTSPILQQIQVPVISNRICREKYQSLYRRQPIPDSLLNETSVFCAGYETGGIDSCQGIRTIESIFSAKVAR